MIESLEGRITPSNSPPVPQFDAFAIRVLNGTFELDVLANDSDPDGDTLAITSVSSSQSGTLSITDNDTLEFTPNSEFRSRRIQGFTYGVSDGCIEVLEQGFVAFLESDPEVGSDFVVVQPQGEEKPSDGGDSQANDAPVIDVINVQAENDPPVISPPIGIQDEVGQKVVNEDIVSEEDLIGDLTSDFANPPDPAADILALFNDQQAAIRLNQSTDTPLTVDAFVSVTPEQQKEIEQEIRQTIRELDDLFGLPFLEGSSGGSPEQKRAFPTIRLKTEPGSAQEDLATLTSDLPDSITDSGKDIPSRSGKTSEIKGQAQEDLASLGNNQSGPNGSELIATTGNDPTGESGSTGEGSNNSGTASGSATPLPSSGSPHTEESASPDGHSSGATDPDADTAGGNPPQGKSSVARDPDEDLVSVPVGRPNGFPTLILSGGDATNDNPTGESSGGKTSVQQSPPDNLGSINEPFSDSGSDPQRGSNPTTNRSSSELHSSDSSPIRNGTGPDIGDGSPSEDLQSLPADQSSVKDTSTTSIGSLMMVGLSWAGLRQLRHLRGQRSVTGTDNSSQH